MPYLIIRFLLYGSVLALAVHLLNNFYQHHINWQAALFGGEDMFLSKAQLYFNSGVPTQQLWDLQRGTLCPSNLCSSVENISDATQLWRSESDTIFKLLVEWLVRGTHFENQSLVPTVFCFLKQDDKPSIHTDGSCFYFSNTTRI